MTYGRDWVMKQLFDKLRDAGETRRWTKWKTRGVGEHFVQLGLLLLWLRLDWAEPFNMGRAKEGVVLVFIVLCVRVTLLRVFYAPAL